MCVCVHRMCFHTRGMWEQRTQNGHKCIACKICPYYAMSGWEKEWEVEGEEGREKQKHRKGLKEDG